MNFQRRFSGTVAKPPNTAFRETSSVASDFGKGKLRAFQVGIRELNQVNRLLRFCYNKRCRNRLDTKEVGKKSTKDAPITDSAAYGIKTAGLLFRLL